jgi:hypothetical protein
MFMISRLVLVLWAIWTLLGAPGYLAAYRPRPAQPEWAGAPSRRIDLFNRMVAALIILEALYSLAVARAT